MAGIIAQNILDDIRARNDIVELIGSYIPLKRAGAAFRALCPFHKEKTPSFNVHPQRQIFHCFGCGAGGDVFGFVMKYENVDFMNAVRLLARRAGVALEFTEREKGAAADKERLFKLHEDAARWFRKLLLEYSKAEVARRYLQQRKLDDDWAEQFLIGYAPEASDALDQWATKKGYSRQDLQAAGLVSVSGEENGPARYYARFRHRLMFPIRDELGRVVGFSGRLLDDQEKAAKYVNSPETILFKKGRVLFALDRARRAMTDSRTAILCEGQIDTIRCHQAGIANTVAPQGTALTEEQSLLLKRYADEVVLVYDADTAGQEAAQRSAEVCLNSGLSVRIACLTVGKDPDIFIQEQGAQEFLNLVEKGKSLLDFQIDRLKIHEDLSTEAGLLRAARAVLETIRRAPSEIQRDQLIRQAARRLAIQEDALRRDLNRLTQKQRSHTVSPSTTARVSAGHPADEVYLAELMVAHPEQLEMVRNYLPLQMVTDADCRRIIESVLAAPEAAGAGLLDRLGEDGEECRRLAAQIMSAPSKILGNELSPAHAIQDMILALRRKHLERHRQELRHQLPAAPETQKHQISVECHQLTLDIQAMKQGWDKALPILELLKA